METRQVTVRIDMRVPVKLHEYLVNDARSKKLSFEGLLITYIEEHMKAELQRQRGTRAR
jgi:predicted HicB family RNase H-like nuclease